MKPSIPRRKHPPVSDKAKPAPLQTPESQDPPRKSIVRLPDADKSSGRGPSESLKSAARLSLSSQTWLSRHMRDPFVKAARTLGYRSRAAFKLAEMDEKLSLLRGCDRCLDLGCAPGGWIQMALSLGVKTVVGVDLLPMQPIAGVEFIQGDFTDPVIQGQVMAVLQGQKPQIVLSDMAPNTMGHAKTDHWRIIDLADQAAQFAIEVLPKGGHFVVKTFQGEQMGDVMSRLKLSFHRVRPFKPKASRTESSEIYLIAQDRK